MYLQAVIALAWTAVVVLVHRTVTTVDVGTNAWRTSAVRTSMNACKDSLARERPR